MYLAAHYFLGKRLLARVNPWIGTILLVGPPVVILLFGLGPSTFRLALGLVYRRFAGIQLCHELRRLRGDGHSESHLPPQIRRVLPVQRVDVVDKVVADRKDRIGARVAPA